MERWQSGYHGEDSLRAKAHKMLGIEQKGARHSIPESMSSPGHTKMRPFAEGGHADGGAMKRGGHHHKKHHKPHAESGRRHGLSHDQTDMHIPRRAPTAPIHRVSKERAESLRHGGHAGHRGNERLNVESVREFEHEGRAAGGAMKRGGHHKHHAHHEHHGMKHEEHEYAKKHGKNHKGIGGLLGGLGGTLFGGPLGGMAGSALGSMLPFKKGGHSGHHKGHKQNAHHHAQGGHEMKKGGHHKHHHAAGGTVYEREMVGERPSHKAPRINYEADMKGTRAISKPSSRHQSKKGLHDMEHGQLFAEGGKATGGAMKRGGHHHRKPHKAAGGDMKMAAGGVGKIRHNQASASGSPKGAKRVIRNNLF